MLPSRNGINFQVWCQRNIIEHTDPFDWTQKFAAVGNMNKRGAATFQDCLVSCEVPLVHYRISDLNELILGHVRCRFQMSRRQLVVRQGHLFAQQQEARG